MYYYAKFLIKSVLIHVMTLHFNQLSKLIVFQPLWIIQLSCCTANFQTSKMKVTFAKDRFLRISIQVYFFFGPTMLGTQFIPTSQLWKL